MQFDSFSAFLNMGGYAFFVWLSFGVSFTSLALLVVASNLKQKQLFKQLAGKMKREEKLKLAAKQASLDAEPLS